MQNRTKQILKRAAIGISIMMIPVVGIILYFIFYNNETNILETISLIVAIFAIVISILTTYYTCCKNEDFEYKKHIINILTIRKEKILNIYSNIISSVTSQKNINASPLAFAFLNISIFKIEFKEFYFKLTSILSLYDNLKLATIIEEDDILKILQRLEYEKIDFENYIDTLIINIYIGKISIRRIEKSSLTD